MTFYPHALNELHCDEDGIAMSQQVSFLGHRMNDGLDLSLRKQNMVHEPVFQFLERISLRFWQTNGLLAACIERLQYDLFRYFCSVFSLLGSVFLFFFFLLHRVFDDVCCATHFDMACIDSDDHQTFENVWENHQEVLFANTTCTPYPYKFLSSVDGV